MDFTMLRSWKIFSPSLRVIQRMFAALIELVLQTDTLLISLHGANRLNDVVDPRLCLKLAQFPSGRRAVAGVMIREARVPPNANIYAFRKLHTRLIGPRILRSTIQMHQVWTRNHAQR